uniref:(northern house mosquito) hypothetical protein n=1 Tax=Culex pipiens TaxID=7175 RepID=A0A8D8BN37_CULPI
MCVARTAFRSNVLPQYEHIGPWSKCSRFSIQARVAASSSSAEMDPFAEKAPPPLLEEDELPLAELDEAEALRRRDISREEGPLTTTSSTRVRRLKMESRIILMRRMDFL